MLLPKNGASWRLSLALSMVVSAWTSLARADAKGIPFNAEFPAALYPYARHVQTCTALQNQGHEGQDSWGPVSFAGACQTHDHCYHTPGAGWGDCNQAFLTDLRASCDRDLQTDRLRQNQQGPVDNVSLHHCYEAADRLFASVQSAQAAASFSYDQSQEARYLQWVATVVDGVYVEVLNRPATERERQEALSDLTKDNDLRDLKAALASLRANHDQDGLTKPLPNLDTTVAAVTRP